MRYIAGYMGIDREDLDLAKVTELASSPEEAMVVLLGAEISQGTDPKRAFDMAATLLEFTKGKAQRVDTKVSVEHLPQGPLINVTAPADVIIVDSDSGYDAG